MLENALLFWIFSIYPKIWQGLLRGKRSEEHTSELQSPCNLVCRLLLEKKKILQHRRMTRMTEPLPILAHKQRTTVRSSYIQRMLCFAPATITIGKRNSGTVALLTRLVTD